MRGGHGLCLGRFWAGWAFFACLAVACGPASPTPTPAPGTLRVDVTPADSLVLTDGKPVGQTPLTASLPAGSHVVRVEHVGYAPLERAVEVLAGETTLVEGQMRDVAVPRIAWEPLPASVEAGRVVTIAAQATDNVAVTQMRLWIDRQPVAESSGAALQFVWETEGASVGAHALVMQAEDNGGNTAQDSRTIEVKAVATRQASPTAIPTVSQSSAVAIRETSLTVNSYPYEAFLRERIDPAYNVRLFGLDRAAYEASNPLPQSRRFKAVVLENRYLSLTILPELGGRIYRCVFKPSGKNLFYQNAVLKPSFWGPLGREENWWLAAGGIEWALPVSEHGYESGIPWSYSVERGAQETVLTVSDSVAKDRVRAEVRIALPNDNAYFSVTPRLDNPTSQPVRLQFWLNAMLTLGSPSASPNTEFVYPTENMVVHSTGDPSLPGERQIMTWPLFAGRDLSRYGNWRNWLGVFVPEPRQNFVGAYNHDTQLGIARIFPSAVAKGLKLFAFGSDFPARGEYADDGTGYFEMWGGPCKTFWPEDDATLGAGQSLQWTEVWLPFAGIGGLDMATRESAAKASIEEGQIRLGIAVSKQQQANIRLTWNGQPLYQTERAAAPEAPLRIVAALPAGAPPTGKLGVHVSDHAGQTLLEFEKDIP
jgi:hypothetical protein